MQTQGTDEVVVAAGYGLKVYVEHGHLVVCDGVGRQRRNRRFARATSGLQRLVVVGHTGFITLEAMRWLRDVGASFAQIDVDGQLIASSSAERFHKTDLRRAQALAPQSGAGLTTMRELVRVKLERQAATADRLTEELARLDRFGYLPRDPIPEVIRRQASALTDADDLAGVRACESVAGRWYWHLMAHVPLEFEARWSVPDHWRLGGLRTTVLSGFKSSRKAGAPLHALANYAYAILENEAVIALETHGFDPGMGVLHTDKRYRGSLAHDVMEPVRPLADRLILELIEDRTFRRGDFFETREGVCRVGPMVARVVASHSCELRALVEVHVRELAELLGAGVTAPGRRRSSAAAGKGGRRRVTPRAA